MPPNERFAPMPDILLVEDDDATRVGLQALLSTSGMSVAVACSGAQAIACARQLAPRVLVSDWQLDDLVDGIDVAQRMREHDAALPIVFVTGFDATRLTAHAATMDEPVAILTKPVNPVELVELLRGMLDSR